MYVKHRILPIVAEFEELTFAEHRQLVVLDCVLCGKLVDSRTWETRIITKEAMLQAMITTLGGLDRGGDNVAGNNHQGDNFADGATPIGGGGQGGSGKRRRIG